MNKTTEALKMAIEAMTWEIGGEPLPTLMIKAINACKEALESQEQEPVAWMNVKTDEVYSVRKTLNVPNFVAVKAKFIPLYTHPTQPLSDDEIYNKGYEDGYKSCFQQMKNKQPLTDDEILKTVVAFCLDEEDEQWGIQFARAIEQAHGIGVKDAG